MTISLPWLAPSDSFTPRSTVVFCVRLLVASARPPAPAPMPADALTAMAFAPMTEWVATLTAAPLTVANSPSCLMALAAVLFLPSVAVTVPSATAIARDAATPAVEPAPTATVVASTLS